MDKHDSSVVRICAVGFGKIARTRFLPAAARVPGVKLTALGTRNPGRLGEKDFPPGVSPRVLGYEELLAEGRNLADVAYIALPNDLHEEWVLRAAEAGMHVLCEKPLACTHTAAVHCRNKCHEQGVLLAEAFMYRHDPRHGYVRDLMSTGTLGKVHLVEASFSYLLEDPSNIRLQVERQGGALMDVGCYGIDLARLLFAEEPIVVTALCMRRESQGVDQLTAVTLLFPSETMAVVTVSTHLARHHSYRVRGTQGTVTVPNAFVPADSDPTQVIVEPGNGERQTVSFPPFTTFEAQIKHFAAAVRANDPSRLSPMEDGVSNAFALEAARQSLSERLKLHAHRGLSMDDTELNND